MEKKNPLVWGMLLRALIIMSSVLLKKEGTFANPYFDGILDFGDIKFVWERYAEWTWEGFTPYADFNVEFPPLFILIIIVPYSFFKIVGIFPFEIWFTFWIMLADFLILKVLEMIQEDGRSSLTLTIWLWAIFPPIPLLLLARFDSWPILFLLLAIKYDLEEKTLIATMMAIFGALMKFFPAFYLVAIFIKSVRQRKDLSQLLMGGFLGILPIMVLVTFRLGAIDGLFWMARFHMEKGTYPNSFFGAVYLLLGSPQIVKTIFTISYLISVLGIVAIKPDEKGIFYSLEFFAIFNWHYTPQYFLWPVPFGYSNARRNTIVASSIYFIAFCVQTYVNFFTYTSPGYIPTLG